MTDKMEVKHEKSMARSSKTRSNRCINPNPSGKQEVAVSIFGIKNKDAILYPCRPIIIRGILIATTINRAMFIEISNPIETARATAV